MIDAARLTVPPPTAPLPDDAARLRRRWLLLVASALVLLTLADIRITQLILANGLGVEFNPVAAAPDGSLRTGRMLAVNAVFTLALLAAFGWGARRAADVPAALLDHWPSRLFDFGGRGEIRRARARERAPIRYVSLALMIILVKTLIVTSNLLLVLGLPNPVSMLAEAAAAAGLAGGAQYWAAYLAIVAPCYGGGVAAAVALLRRLQAAGRPDERTAWPPSR